MESLLSHYHWFLQIYSDANSVRKKVWKLEIVINGFQKNNV